MRLSTLVPRTQSAFECGAILIASVEYEDLANLCDRVIVFRHGKAVNELRKPNLNEAMIVEQCFKTETGAA